MKFYSIFLLSILLTKILIAQDNYEIQVYGSATQTKGSTMFESHTNFTFDGEKNSNDGVRPTHHAFHETVEITTGITNCFELGFYLFTNYTSPFGFQFVGTHIRPRVCAPQSWKLPIGLSLSAELGTQKAEYADDTWSLDLRPIIDKQVKKFYWSFNPTLGVSLKSNQNNSTPVFEPNLKLAYQAFKNWNIGVEYFGATGKINNFEAIQNQQHALFLAFDMLNNTKWELNFGPGYGLTNSTDRFVFKMYFGRRINWKTKSTAAK